MAAAPPGRGGPELLGCASPHSTQRKEFSHRALLAGDTGFQGMSLRGITS